MVCKILCHIYIYIYIFPSTQILAPLLIYMHINPSRIFYFLFFENSDPKSEPFKILESKTKKITKIKRKSLEKSVYEWEKEREIEPQVLLHCKQTLFWMTFSLSRRARKTRRE